MTEDQQMCSSAGPDPDERPVSFLGRPAPAGMDLRVVTIPAHSQLVYEPAEWAGALVVVEAGEIELECCGATSARFGASSVLFFGGLGLRAVHNSGDETVLLSAVSRRGHTNRRTAISINRVGSNTRSSPNRPSSTPR